MATQLQVRRENDIQIIEIEGYIDANGGEHILAECNRRIEEGGNRLVLNLEKSHLINSMGIMYLLEAADKAREAGGGMIFCGASPTIDKTFEIMGVLKVASICDSEEEAIRAIGDE